MHLAKRRTLIFYIMLIAGLLALQGCSANGYITASVQSVIGLDVSENPQTQMPHVRFGYIRNQLYYVPTGKVVVGQGGTSGRADEAPALVSSIKLDSTFAQSMAIEERFAIGQAAIESPAAQALFNPEGKPVITVMSGPGVSYLQQQIRKIIQDPQKNKMASDWIKGKYPTIDTKLQDPDRFIDNPQGGEADLLNLLKQLQ